MNNNLNRDDIKDVLKVCLKLCFLEETFFCKNIFSSEFCFSSKCILLLNKAAGALIYVEWKDNYKYNKKVFWRKINFCFYEIFTKNEILTKKKKKFWRKNILTKIFPFFKLRKQLFFKNFDWLICGPIKIYNSKLLFYKKFWEPFETVIFLKNWIEINVFY